MKKHSLITMCIVGALGLTSCSKSGGPIPIDPPVQVDPVQPPDLSAPVLSFVISGSVVDKNNLTVSGVTLVFRENGELATNLVDVNGDAFSDLTAELGNFSFTVADGATLGTITITAEATGYLRKVSEFDLSTVVENTNIQLQVAAKPVAATPVVTIQTQETTLDAATVVAEVIIKATTATTAIETVAVTTEVIIPAATQMQTADGAPTAGTTLRIEVTAVNTKASITTDEAEEATTVADFVPEGLNDAVQLSTGITSEVYESLAITNIEMFDELGNQIERFSQPIRITVDVPNNDGLQSGDVLLVSSYSNSEGKWIIEDSPATLGGLNTVNNTFPGSFLTDHLTYFSFLGAAPSCDQGFSVQTSGDAIPSQGLTLKISTSKFNSSFPMKVTNAQYLAPFKFAASAVAKITVRDADANVWYTTLNDVTASVPGFEVLCGTANITLTAPAVPTVDEVLTVNSICSNDTTVSVPITNAAVTYNQLGRAPNSATVTGDGGYNLIGLVQDATYSVTINPRFRDSNGVQVPTQTTTITADQTNESFDVSAVCAVGTGLG
ncbi:MAG: hypothetical protein ACJA2G_001718 [Cognaticolwellia sp.]|jgi:hypothetical protein